VIIRRCIRFGIVLLLLQPLQAYCDDMGRWLLPSCKARDEPLHDLKIWPAICFLAQSENYILSSAHAPQMMGRKEELELTGRTVNRLYSGIHMSSLFSLHGRFLYSHMWSNWERKEITKDKWESAFIQLGNSVLNNFSGAIGLLDLPFGLDFRVVSEGFRAQKSDKYWPLHILGGKMSWIRHDRTLIEVGLSSESDELHTRELYRHQTGLWSFRISKDLPALEGTKLLFSYARQENVSQSIGFATLNLTRNGSTSFEWVRIIPLGILGEDFSQILRLNHRGPWSHLKRWYFEYETERSTMWLLVTGYEYSIFHHAQLNLELGYQRRTSDGLSSQWLVGGGVKVNL